MFEDLIEEFQPFARDLVHAAGQAGLQPRVTSTRRTPTQQARLYRRWQSGLSPLPAAPPGTSAHEFGYAFDMVVSPWEALADVGYTWQQWGGIWGGDRDPVHFQFPGFFVPAGASGAWQDQQDPSFVRLCDFLSGFSPLGPVQLADSIATYIAPLTSSPQSLERKVQRFIQGPCSTLYRKLS
jgi:hypothetical protein